MADGKKKKRFNIRQVFRWVVFVLGFMLCACIAALGLMVYYNSPPGMAIHEADGIWPETEDTVLIEVRKGESAQSVGMRLKQAGLIRNRFFWIALFRVQPEFVKSGTYRLTLPLSQIAIRGILVSGRQLLIRVTIPEGVTLKKTAKIFEEAGICEADAFLDAASSKELLGWYNVPGETMEGYLFPDTYLFPAAFPADMVVKKMADTFFEKITLIDPGALRMSSSELNKRVIIASIVEREYRIEKEAPLMAGVFYNRLNIGMALQSCATVEYIITEIQGKPHPELLYNRDTEIQNPYNTYIRPGLPPGPICAPGFTALDAAFHPDKNDYLYFRLSGEGAHYFSKTFDDHIKAGLLYVKRR